MKNPDSVFEIEPAVFWLATAVGVAKDVAALRVLKAVAKTSVNRTVAIRRFVAREHCGRSMGPERGAVPRALRSATVRLGWTKPTTCVGLETGTDVAPETEINATTCVGVGPVGANALALIRMFVRRMTRVSSPGGSKGYPSR